MRNLINTGIIFLCVLIVGATGHYITNVRQPAEIKKIDDTIELAKLETKKVEELLVQQAASREIAEQTTAKWRTRYKEIPDSLNTAKVALYLESLTAEGFERFDVNLEGEHQTKDINYYRFKINATSYFNSMYHFVWHVENNPQLYRINDLKVSYTTVYRDNSRTSLPRALNMVNFSFTLDAFFHAADGVAASEDELMAIPRNLLARHNPAHNSFYPIVRTDLPPNDEMLLDVEQAKLVSIIGEQAIFEGNGYQYYVRAGDRIYLGEVIAVDPQSASVEVQLNKGGKTMRATLKVDVGERFRQAQVPGVEIHPVENEDDN
ncbi:MAG: hypothetical protein KDD65_05285 [Bacteroidetes bacterium]|nr:hypothetical protein [Bacteroidota bacterium]